MADISQDDINKAFGLDSSKWSEVGGSGSDEQYEVFKFENENDMIEGALIEKKSGIGLNQSKMYVFELKDGSKKAIWGSTVLDDRMENIQIGEVVVIVYIGKPKGKKYKAFRVFREQGK